MVNDFRNAPDAGGNHRDFTCHRLEGNEAKRLQFARQQKDVGDREELAHIILLPHKQDITGNAVSICEPLCLWPLRHITDHQQASSSFLVNESKNSNHVFNTLHRPKIRYVDQNPFIVAGKLSSKTHICGRAVNITVHKIGHYCDGPLDLKFLNRALPEVLGDRSNGITLFDTEPCDRKVRAVITDQCNVSTMESCHERHDAVLQHHFGKISTDRVSTRILNMEDIEIKTPHNLWNLGGEQEILRWIFEQRIREKVDLVQATIAR